VLPSIFLSRSIKQVSILMYALSRIVVARRPVRQPHKPGNYEACAEALGQFIGDCMCLSREKGLIPKKSEPACLLNMHVSMWRIGATERIMVQSLRSV
jgi:hypothetical protein